MLYTVKGVFLVLWLVKHLFSLVFCLFCWTIKCLLYNVKEDDLHHLTFMV